MEFYDLAILGGGPAGYFAAERAAAAGMRTILFEAEKLGGVCLNEGCMPTKVMLNASKLLYYAKHGASYGVTSNAEDGGAGFAISHPAVMARKERVVKTLVAGVRAKLKAVGADAVNGRAAIEKRSADRFIVSQQSAQDAGRQIEAARILVATGSSPIIPKVEGLGLNSANGGAVGNFAITSKEALELPEIPKQLIIVGGGVIGLELADYFNSAGSSVTIIELLDRIANPMDEDISKILMGNLKKKGIQFCLGCRFTKISPPGAAEPRLSVAEPRPEAAESRPETTEPRTGAAEPGQGAVEFESGAGGDAKRETLPADKVLLSIGRRPNSADLGLERLGVCIERGAVATDDNMRTNIPNIYAAGDVNGKSMLAHTAYREADCAVAHMLDPSSARAAKMRYDAVPSVIYTNPEAAGVGETGESAAKKGLGLKTVKLPMRYSGRYIAETDGGDGICKVLFDERAKTVAGLHMIGPYASEIIVSAAFMVESKWPVKALRSLTFPHPTVGEAVREALYEFDL